MSTQFNHEKVFIHWPLGEYDIQPPKAFGLLVVRDPLYPGELPLETRFLRSGADIALIDTHTMMRGCSDDLLKSDILRARAVCATFSTGDGRSIEFNRQLDDLGFLTLWLNELHDKPKLAGLFLRALENIKATS